mmetsp:Transcript_17572/g.30264  ORF Transcript_17572/g.30264 Transcript_17572/m.30264 type:complete len:288 (-) Transcript_17572:625-1488(-)
MFGVPNAVARSAPVPVSDRDAFRFPDVHVRGPIHILLDGAGIESVRLKMPREVDLAAITDLRYLSVDDEVDVVIKGALELGLGSPISMKIDLKQPGDEFASKLLKAIKSSEAKMVVREAREVVSMDPNQKLKVRRSGVSSVGIRVVDGEHRSLAVRKEPTTLEAVLSEQLIQNFQNILVDWYRKAAGENAPVRLTQISKASAKATIGYRLVLDLQFEPQAVPTQWEALLIRSADGFDSVTVSRVDTGAEGAPVYVATSYDSAIFANQTEFMTGPRYIVPSIGPTIRL